MKTAPSFPFLEYWNVLCIETGATGILFLTKLGKLTDCKIKMDVCLPLSHAWYTPDPVWLDIISFQGQSYCLSDAFVKHIPRERSKIEGPLIHAR